MSVWIRKIVLLGFSAGLLLATLPAIAADDDEDSGQLKAPQEREALENAQPENPVLNPETKSDDETAGLPMNIRIDAIKEAALSYGARGGLAYRTYEIRQQLDTHAAYLDKVYDFRRLLIAAPSGLMIEPPVISEEDKALIITNEGQEAAVADRIFNINKKAKIVSAARVWHSYLERDWGDMVTPPPDILMPENEKEREAWIKNIRLGWEKGVDQADEIYEDDVNMLTADYQGMVRYRLLLAQGMVSPPYALQVDRGVTGGGDQMRVGDRAIQITGVPELRPDSDQWQPVNR